MLFRFTLDNTIEGSQVISNPDGWKEIKLKLERDKEFHSLVEIIELPLIFCGSNGDYDGGYDYIRNVEDTQGVDAQIEIMIEVSDNGGAYETFFEGLLELETIKEISDAEPYKLECNIVRNDFWSKFVNRKSQKVNLNSTTDLDGGTRAQISDVLIQLPSQIVQKKTQYSGTQSGSHIFTTGFNLSQYSQVGLDMLQGEILDSFQLPFSLEDNATSVVNVIEIMEDGTDLTIDVEGGMRFIASIPGALVTQITGTVFVKRNTESAITVATTTLSSGLGTSISKLLDLSGSYTFNDVIVGDLIYVYAQWNLLVDDSPRTTTTTLGFEGMSIEITQKTTYVDTATESFLLRDAARSILSRIVGRDNVLYSNYLGDEAPEGCATNFAITKGLHIRGYQMADKPMTMSFDEWWHGANPIFNLGLGYETISGTEFIRIEDKAHFYDDDPILTLSNVDKITRVYDKDSIFKNIEIGYEKWSAESASGVDDPQTKHTYNTRFKIIGKDEKILSGFIAASLAIEQTRRNRIEFGKDWRLDEDIFIIALSNDSSPYQPELDENFTGITNLLNSDTRYNIRLTPARNFIRWRPYFNGCLQGYADSYKFASGEGNYDMQSTGDSCDSGTIAENQNISLTSDHYHLAQMYEFEYYISWEDYKTVRANRHKAILVSNTSSNHKTCHIQEMEFDHYNSIAKFTVWIKD